MTYGGSTYGGAPYASTSNPEQLLDRPRTFRVIRDGNVVEDSVFDVDPVVDTANPFGDYCVIKMDDRGGDKFAEYPRGTRVDVEIAFTATSRVERFTGYTVERRETEQSGADVLEVEAYSFDQFLRRNNVSNDQAGRTITQALADIIQTDTPVSFVAGNVEVGDEQELTRGYQGEPVENVLRDLAFKSNNEDFGVNDSLEFFFRPRESVHIERGIDNTQWFNYDIPELGKETVNEVEVWFDDGNESVIVDDGTDKLDLQDSLGLEGPGRQRAELNRPGLTSIDDAEDEGRKYLKFRNATLSGTVTTYGLFDARPGDTIDVTITPRGIDTEFVIAGLEYRWGRDETILTIVEQRGDVDDILTELNESVQRQEMAGADRDAPKNRITTTNATGVVSVSVNADGATPDASRFVNLGRSLVRDAWTGESYSAISSIVVGSDGSGLSRSNTSLVSQTNSASTTQSLPDAKSVEFSASITQTGVEEVGLEASDGALIARAVFDAPVDLSGTVTVTLTVSNDDSVSRGVLTNGGQTAVRDVLASNSPSVPDTYAYGSDGSAVSTADTALGNEVVTTSLDEILIQDANSTSDWDAVTGGVSNTTPVTTANDSLSALQSCFTQEAEDFDTSVGGIANFDSEWSNGEGIGVFGVGDYVEWEFTLDYEIPAGAFDFWVRWGASDDGTGGSQGLVWALDGTAFSDFSPTTNLTATWDELAQDNTAGEGGFTGSLEAGTHTIRMECTNANGDGFVPDVIAPRDNRFTYTNDNDNGGSDGYLDGPELYPDSVVESLSTATTRRDVTTANFDLTANDTSGNFYVELANDGSTFTRVNNSSTGSVSFAGAERDVDANISLGRFGSRTTATPQTGFQGQSISAWNLFANPDAVVSDDIGVALTRAVIPPNTITSETLREAGLKSNGVLLARHELAEFSVLADQRVSSSESTSFVSDN